MIIKCEKLIVDVYYVFEIVEGKNVVKIIVVMYNIEIGVEVQVSMIVCKGDVFGGEYVI